MFITVEELKTSVLNANLDAEYINPAIYEAEDVYLREILGDALYNVLVNKINGNTLTGKYQTLVNSYIKPYLTYKVQSILVVPINYKMRNAGVINQYDQGFSTTTVKDTAYLAEHYDGRAEFYANRLTTYLKQNANDFPEYGYSSSNVTNPTDSQNVTTLYLGGTRKKCNCLNITGGGGGTADTVDWDNIANKPNFAEVATSGDYEDLQNKPTIPTKTSDLTNDSGFTTFSGDYNDLTNTPNLATVATSGDYEDLSNTPTIPTVNNATLTIKQDGVVKGTFTANADEDAEINLQSGGSGGDVDWSDITNKPNFADVATSGSYYSLSNTPDMNDYVYKEDYNQQMRNIDNALDEMVFADALCTINNERLDTRGNFELVKVEDIATVATTGDYEDLLNTPTLATVATTGDYRDLFNKPTIPTVNDGTLTIQKNGTTIATFTANDSSIKTANITVPTNETDLGLTTEVWTFTLQDNTTVTKTVVLK